MRTKASIRRVTSGPSRLPVDRETAEIICGLNIVISTVIMKM